MGGYFLTKMWEPKRRTRQCCRSAQKRIFSKCCNWKACTSAEQLGTGEAPGRDHSLISSQQERTMLTEQRVLQIQAILSSTDFSANREKCCKAKQGLFPPTAWLFPNPSFWQIFSSFPIHWLSSSSKREAELGLVWNHTHLNQTVGVYSGSTTDVCFDGSPSVQIQCSKDKNPNIICRSSSQSVQRHCCESQRLLGPSLPLLRSLPDACGPDGPHAHHKRHFCLSNLKSTLNLFSCVIMTLNYSSLKYTFQVKPSSTYEIS